MIQTLHISNYAIIEELEIQFSKGLTIMTGETGAGKSIVLGALGLIMGNRVDTKILFQGEKKCIVEGSFDISSYGLKDFFKEYDIDFEEETVIRREITPTGRSRAFVNDTPVNLKILQQLSGCLIDLHQQFDTRDIHDVSFQLRMIDALAGNGKILEQYRLLYRQYKQNESKLSKLIQQSENAAKESDFLSFQLEELNKAELVHGEQKQMEQQLSQLDHAEAIKKKLSGAYQALIEKDQSVINQLRTIAISLNQIRAYHPKLEGLLSKFEGLLLELEETANDFEQIAESTEYNPERIIEYQTRLDLIYRLQHKHHVSEVSNLLQIKEDLQQQLASFADLSEDIVALEKQLKQQKKELLNIAIKLSNRRKQVVPSFQRKVHQLLGQLSMEHARIRVDILPSDQLLPTGTDIVEFLFAPNKGSRFQSIKGTASGGELSRLTLCIKSLVASSIPLPTLIFDEIDAGVSGDVALKMGQILSKLSNEHQVTVITHSPQVASNADVHYFIYKKVIKDNTYTKVKRLTEEERIKAIAAMLSQNPPTDFAIANAKELLAMNSR